MTEKTCELQRVISASVRDMLDAYRIQAQAGPVSDQALEGIIFRATYPIMDSLAPYPAEQRAALLPRVVRLMLATFLEDVAGDDGPGARGMSNQNTVARVGSRREGSGEQMIVFAASPTAGTNSHHPSG